MRPLAQVFSPADKYIATTAVTEFRFRHVFSERPLTKYTGQRARKSPQAGVGREATLADRPKGACITRAQCGHSTALRVARRFGLGTVEPGSVHIRVTMSPCIQKWSTTRFVDAHAQAGAQDSGSLHPRRLQTGRLPETLARHRQRRRSAALPAAFG